MYKLLPSCSLPHHLSAQLCCLLSASVAASVFSMSAKSTALGIASRHSFGSSHLHPTVCRSTPVQSPAMQVLQLHLLHLCHLFRSRLGLECCHRHSPSGQCQCLVAWCAMVTLSGHMSVSCFLVCNDDPQSHVTAASASRRLKALDPQDPIPQGLTPQGFTPQGHAVSHQRSLLFIESPSGMTGNN